MEGIIIAVLWSVCSLLVMLQYAPYCKDMPRADFMLAGVIFIVGGPFFAIVNVLEGMLNIIMPEGWDDESRM